MKKTNLHEAKTKKSKRKPGIWSGKVTIKKDFDQLPIEFMKNFK